MADRVDLALAGFALPGYEVEQVAVNLARLLKISQAHASALLQGQVTVIKQGLDEQQVPSYRAALERAGAMVQILPQMASASARDVQPAVTTKPVQVSTGEGSVTDRGPLMTCPACQLEQPRRAACRGCGADVEKAKAVLAQKARMARLGETTAWRPPSASLVEDAQDESSPAPRFFSLSFEGRLDRVHYLTYLLGATCLLMAGMLPVLGTGSSPGSLGVSWVLVGAIILFIMNIRYAVLRLHDIGRHGNWALLLWVPIVQLMLLVVLMLMPGEEGGNAYGYQNEPAPVWMKVIACVFGLMLLLTYFEAGTK
ncbi:uncharacterized membrane protein YhaH (DUF805 family) [Chitinivorax tropicus]|uniref:Uncharacterized membrane protein YhaH (DUF805 family) n=1 Tax=Chitinivorax tropicus TaxID=714531 RepID=A0A840MBX0_9PROT|nr:DUF805 domain-containing protein [Chitinivorax tropicus]MBB5016824.1 uncharacterized membrane protein YhaH (DUF805 family) [Chitinivorax tropicus]